MPTDLLLGRTATSSSYVMPFAPQKAVDGSAQPLSRWLCSRLPGWLCVDLGNVHLADSWSFVMMGAAGWLPADQYSISDFKLQCSLDGTDWADVDTLTGNKAAQGTRPFPVTAFRYARLYVTKGLNCNLNLASVVGLSLYEADAAQLQNLTVSSGTLNPPFQPSVISYRADVDESVASVALTPTAQSASETITVNGAQVSSGQPSAPIPLSFGPNPASVQVTAPNMAATNYTVNVVRTSAYLTNLMLSNAALDPAFSRNTLSGYTAAVGSDAASTLVTPTAEDSTASITVNGTATSSGKGVSVAVDPGSNPVSVTVTTALDAQRTYQATVYRLKPLYLSNLVATYGKGVPVTLQPTFNSAVLSFRATVPSSTTTVAVTPSLPNGMSATITLNGTQVQSGSVNRLSLVESVTNVSIGLTDANGNSTDYTLSVQKS